MGNANLSRCPICAGVRVAGTHAWFPCRQASDHERPRVFEYLEQLYRLRRQADLGDPAFIHRASVRHANGATDRDGALNVQVGEAGVTIAAERTTRRCYWNDG